MDDEFDVVREMQLAVEIPKGDCELPVVWQYDKPTPAGATPTVFQVPGAFVAGFEANGVYVIFTDHPRDDVIAAMKLAGLVAVAKLLPGKGGKLN